MEKSVKQHKDLVDNVRKEVSKVLVGQEGPLNGCLRAIIANGNVLVEGVPGIAKTLLIRALSVACGCTFNRIQFTVDLLPTDITGITTYDRKKGFTVVKGPIFANFVIADEINRASPKTQSALLEAMQEKKEIMKRNITLQKFEDFKLKPILNQSKIIRIQQAVKAIHLGEDIEKYIVKIVDATRNSEKYHLKMGKYIEYGCSPRGSIGLFIGSKAESLMHGSHYVTPQHVKNVAHEVLRHRIILNYEAQAEGIRTDEVIDEILSRVPVP